LINKLIYFIFFYILFLNNCYANIIVVVNIEELINSNNIYQNILNEIENNQKKYLEKFKIKEDQLDNLFQEIEDSKLILSESELNKIIDEYNIKLNKFRELVNDFNLHYQNEIINIRKLVLQEIIVLLEKYANDNNIDLILDSTSYLIASNQINITSKIKKKLENIELKLDYNEFEKN